VPTLSELGFEVALDVDAADGADVDRLRAHGWHVVDPKDAVPDPSAFRRYVQHSSAEFSVAQGIYVETQSGWFSDRTVRYLASGKPAVVQETGWSRNYPSGKGLLRFTTVAEAVDAANQIASDYAAHSRAAREIAEEFFDSDKVLTQLLETVEA
jgi:glycosyltransferase involved in cell wall biosynthesis